MPASIDALRERLCRDRRWTERRHGAADTRPFPRERRNDDRRGVGPQQEADWNDAEDLIVEENEDSELSTCGQDPSGCTIHNAPTAVGRRDGVTGYELTCIAPLDGE